VVAMPIIENPGPEMLTGGTEWILKQALRLDEESGVRVGTFATRTWDQDGNPTLMVHLIHPEHIRQLWELVPEKLRKPQFINDAIQTVVGGVVHPATADWLDHTSVKSTMLKVLAQHNTRFQAVLKKHHLKQLEAMGLGDEFDLIQVFGNALSAANAETFIGDPDAAPLLEAAIKEGMLELARGSHQAAITIEVESVSGARAKLMELLLLHHKEIDRKNGKDLLPESVLRTLYEMRDETGMSFERMVHELLLLIVAGFETTKITAVNTVLMILQSLYLQFVEAVMKTKDLLYTERIRNETIRSVIHRQASISASYRGPIVMAVPGQEVWLGGFDEPLDPTAMITAWLGAGARYEELLVQESGEGGASVEHVQMFASLGVRCTGNAQGSYAIIVMPMDMFQFFEERGLGLELVGNAPQAVYGPTMSYAEPIHLRVVRR
jgi:hypothetical protein